MEQDKRPIDPSLEALFGASEALNLAVAQIHCMLVAINAGDKRVDQFALLTHIYESLMFWRDTTSEVEEALCVMQKLPGDTARGYEAARVWFSDLDSRVEQANGCEVPSQLREHFDALPLDRQGSFIDAIGAICVTERVAGKPYAGKYDLVNAFAP